VTAGRGAAPLRSPARGLLASGAGGAGGGSGADARTRTFPGVPEQVRAAREFVAGLLEGMKCCDDAVMVISELVTNALVHTASGRPGGVVTLAVSWPPPWVVLEVTDQGAAGEPVIWVAGGEPAESGHGLYMVACLAESLDWRDEPSGRTVRAVLRA
jgi:anti-sigma regulatory factor (Ser/Thr protein kinase)